MRDSSTFKISYCVTCKGSGYFERLKETLPGNLAAVKADPNAELTILSYGNDPKIDAYFKEHFQNEIDSGILRYASYPAGEHFQMAHAKNMVSRVATGKFLVNLDADNNLGDGYTAWIRKQFERNPNKLVTELWVSPKDWWHHKGGRLQGKPHQPLIAPGRVGTSRENFERLGGYNEHYSGWGGDDDDFARRAYLAGVKIARPPREIIGASIEHSDAERIANMSTEDQERSAALLDKKHQPQELTLKKRIKSNVDNYRHLGRKLATRAQPDGNCGCGTVYVNFSEKPTEIRPLGHPEKQNVKYILPDGVEFESLQRRENWGVHITQTKDKESGWTQHP